MSQSLNKSSRTATGPKWTQRARSLARNLPRSLNLLLLLTASSLSFSAFASQLVEGADRQHKQVDVSQGQQNRLVVEGRRIASVVPSQKGVLTYEKDETLGVLYFALTGENPGNAQVTLFLSDEKGVTYKLILAPKPIPGEEIIVRPPGDGGPSLQTQSAAAAQAAITKAAAPTPARALSYQRRIKDLVLGMADPSVAGSFDIRMVNKEVPLWKEGSLNYVAKVPHGDMVGEKYRLKNTSPTPMLTVEQELYRKGVLAVSIENHTLAPGDSTDIFIVREAAANE